MDQQPAAGSCERCGRAFALIVPEPGPGDLQLDRVTQAFRWCIECGRLVGRACCWTAEPHCVGCAEARAASGDLPGGFAALGMARAAVRQMDGMAAELTVVDEAIARAHASDPRHATEAWRTAWRAAARLRARIEGTREAAAWWLATVPADDADHAAELGTELAALSADLDGRWQRLATELAEAGQRLERRTDGPRPVRAAAVAVPIREPRRATVPVAPAPTATPDAPDASPSPAARAPAPPTAVARPAPSRSRRDSGTRRAPSPSPATPKPPRSPARSAAPSRPAPTTVPSPAGRVVPIAPPMPQPQPVREQRPIVGPARPNAATVQPGPEVAAHRHRRSAAGLVLAVVLALAAAGAAVVLATVAVPDTPEARPSEPLAGVGAAPSESEPGMSASPSASASAEPGGASGPSESVVSVDLHPMGPVDADELPLRRTIGAVEVVALPTPFDRSLRLPAGSEICLALPGAGDASRAVAFDLHMSEVGTGGSLSIVLPRGDSDVATAVDLDLATLAALDPEEWHRLAVTVAADDAELEVRPVDGGSLIDRSNLTARPAGEPAPGDATCIGAALDAPEAAVLVDNLQAGR